MVDLGCSNNNNPSMRDIEKKRTSVETKEYIYIDWKMS